MYPHKFFAHSDSLFALMLYLCPCKKSLPLQELNEIEETTATSDHESIPRQAQSNHLILILHSHLFLELVCLEQVLSSQEVRHEFLSALGVEHDSMDSLRFCLQLVILIPKV